MVNPHKVKNVKHKTGDKHWSCDKPKQPNHLKTGDKMKMRDNIQIHVNGRIIRFSDTFFTGPSAAKSGYCPPRTDWQGLLGACAPTCRDDSSCPGNQKCCHHGCGLRCIDPVCKLSFSLSFNCQYQAYFIQVLTDHIFYIYRYAQTLNLLNSVNSAVLLIG